MNLKCFCNFFLLYKYFEMHKSVHLKILCSKSVCRAKILKMLFNCYKCATKLPNMKLFFSHLKNIHNINENFVCELCAMNIQTKSGMRRHILNFHDEVKSSAENENCIITTVEDAEATEIPHAEDINAKKKKNKMKKIEQTLNLSIS